MVKSNPKEGYMKKEFRWFGRLLCLVLVSALPLTMVACESDDDEGDDPDTAPVSITGDARFTAQNLSGDTSTVYFDGDYIGSVGPRESRTWDVPSGSHTIRIDNAEKDNSDDLDMTITFQAGQIVTLPFDWDDD